MKIIKEFKEFAVKGSVVDLAVGVIIGGAFGKVVSSLVNDIIMPPIAAATKGIDFKNLTVVLRQGVADVSAVTWNYGMFLQTFIEFLFVAWAVFLLVKAMNKMRRKKEAEPAQQPTQLSKQEQLLTEIRDTLKVNK